MEFSRRNVLALGSGTLAAATLTGLPAFASVTDDMIAEFTGGSATASGALTLTAPEIAENGNTVPIEITAPGAVAVTVFADGNPVKLRDRHTFSKTLAASGSAQDEGS